MRVRKECICHPGILIENIIKISLCFSNQSTVFRDSDLLRRSLCVTLPGKPLVPTKALAEGEGTLEWATEEGENKN